MVSDLRNSWIAALQQKKFKYQLGFVVITLLVILLYLPVYFHTVIASKPGATLNDPILNYFNPKDYSWVIFGIIYFSLFIVLHGLLRKPTVVLLGLSSYLTITCLRMLTMFVFTLEPAEGMIPLHDPLIDSIAYGGGVFAKDLFFSGHVATLTLLALLEDRPWVKVLIILGAVLVGWLLLIQRVHYSIDVMAAPFFTYGIVWGMKQIMPGSRM